MVLKVYGVCDKPIAIHSTSHDLAGLGDCICFPLLRNVSQIRSEISAIGVSATATITVAIEYDRKLMEDLMVIPPLLRRADFLDDDNCVIMTGEVFRIEIDGNNIVYFQVDGQ